MDDLKRHLKELESADVVAFGGVGFAGEVLPVTRAYDAIAGQLSPALRPKLDRLLDRATSAGKIYAATLLSRLDPQAGREAWQRLAGDRSAVNTFSGCVKGRTTLSAYASSQRDGSR
jgi:hypothetical protein